MEASRPLSFRGVFLFSSAGGIIFSQRFPLVESRVPPNLPSFPTNEALSKFIKSDVAPFVGSQSVFHFADTIELVLVTGKNFCIGVVPLIITPPTLGAPYVEVAASFSFLNFLETISRAILKPITPQSPPHALANFRYIVNQVLPFGSPVIHDVYFASQLTSPGEVRRFNAGYQAVVERSFIPSWKTFLIFPKQQLDLKLREVVLGAIDGQQDTFDVYGEIRCIASVNYLPDVTLPLSWLDKVENLSCHHCVKRIEGQEIVFSPVTGNSQLILWRSILDRTRPPVDGKYEIRDDGTSLRLALTINVHPPVKNVVAQLAFPGRGAITKQEFQNPGGGSLRMSKKEATVSWTVKLGENGTQTLPGVLNFENRPAPGTDKCRVYVSFKSKKRSFSGLSIEKERVSLIPPGTVNVITDASYVTETKRYIFYATPMSAE